MAVNLKSFNSDIIKNYLYSFLNLSLRISLNLIAIPVLSDSPAVLAIYSICISFGIFLDIQILDLLPPEKCLNM